MLRSFGACLLIIILLTLTAAVRAQESTERRKVYIPVDDIVAEYPSDSISLGTGWNSLAGKKTQSICTKLTERKDSGDETFADIKYVVDNESFSRAIESSADAQVSVIAGLGGGPKARYASQVEFKAENVNFAVYAGVRRGARSADPDATGTVHVHPRLEHLSPEEFYRRCGDRFVAAIYSGAELYGQLSISETSLEKKQEVANSVPFSGPAFDLSGNSAETIQSYQKNHSLRILVRQSGREGDSVPVTYEELVQRVRELPQSALRASKRFTVVLRSYSQLKGNFTEPYYPEALQNQTQLVQQYGRLKTLYDQAMDLHAHPERAVLGRGVTAEDLAQLGMELHGRLRAIEKTLLECRRNATRCQLSPADQVSDYTYRIRMPLVGSFSTQDLIQQAERGIAAAKKGIDERFAALDRTIKGLPPAVRVVGAQWRTALNDSPEIQGKRQAINEGRENLANLQSQYPTSLKRAIGQQWVDLPNLARCKISASDSGCITPSEVDELKAKVKVTGAP